MFVNEEFCLLVFLLFHLTGESQHRRNSFHNVQSRNLLTLHLVSSITKRYLGRLSACCVSRPRFWQINSIIIQLPASFYPCTFREIYGLSLDTCSYFHASVLSCPSTKVILCMNTDIVIDNLSILNPDQTQNDQISLIRYSAFIESMI